MRQHIVHDQASAAYTGGIDSVWSSWEPALRRAERLLLAGGSLHDANAEDSVTELRRAQYQAHIAAEFVSGLRPPLPAVDAHEYLVSTLESCRETLGVLAVRAELDELDENTTDIGLHSVANTREAFRAARSTTLAAYQFTEHLRPMYLEQIPARSESRGIGVLLWGLVAVCAVLFTLLLFEVFLLTSPA